VNVWKVDTISLSKIYASAGFKRDGTAGVAEGVCNDLEHIRSLGFVLEDMFYICPYKISYVERFIRFSIWVLKKEVFKHRYSDKPYKIC